MTTYNKCKFAQCSGNNVISSCTVCITLLNSEDIPTMRSISISQILVLPDITDVIVLSISHFFAAHVSSHASPRFHPCFTRFLPRLSYPPRSLSRIPRNRAHDCRIAPKVKAMAWHFIPRAVLNALREFVVFLLCFLQGLIFK